MVSRNARHPALSLLAAAAILAPPLSTQVPAPSTGYRNHAALTTAIKITPTHTQQDVENRISRPNWVALEGGEVLAGFVMAGGGGGFGGAQMPLAVEQRARPARLNVTNIPGMGTVTVRWVVRGNGPFTVTADSPKGGVHRATSRSR